MFIEYYESEQAIVHHSYPYDSVSTSDDGCLAKARVLIAADAYANVYDVWSIVDNQAHLKRTVTVEGSAPGGFLSAICFNLADPLTWLDVDPFAPGMIYGREGRVNPRAIGSQENYADGVRSVVIREDRLTAPLFGMYLPDGSALSLMNPAPDTQTIAEEGEVLDPITRIDRRLRFGALGSIEQEDRLSVGYWFPGTEGEITYRGREFPFGQLRQWRRAYHPVEDGLAQSYELLLRVSTAGSFAAYCKDSWRRAWDVQKPQVYPQDIETVRQSSSQLLSDMTHRAQNGMTGIYRWSDGTPSKKGWSQFRFEHISVMGFVGRGTDAGYYLLREAARPETPDEKRHQYREQGNATLDSYAKIPMNPPQAEGFNLFNGELLTTKFVEGGADTLYLRSLAEGAKFALRAWQFAHHAGDEHPNWLAWGKQIADFLLSKQLAEGGVPRIYVVGTGEVYKESPRSTYNVILLWMLMYQMTGEARYLDAARRAGEFCWSDGHQKFNFVGGTIDNPDVIDKEAGALSLEAYLSLYEQTKDDVWLTRAQQAADYTETWIYCWNVPMPIDAADTQLDWETGRAHRRPPVDRNRSFAGR